MKLKLKQNLRAESRFNLEKLKDPEVADLFEATIGGQFAALNPLQENIDNLTESIHGAFVDTASEVIGNTARKKKKSWICQRHSGSV